ncbi:GntR family transcriptional regulator [Ramlibacter sp.]|uniref:GntR family transcriptional regulator n=1 Tax=Ramlibacter sp. TaxID=1917967 RepID=UPI002B605FC6|nr:GntR family transcriptional regulator [Ramlibacter sp.]HWI83817.1 GntR family transcriptional regulator [Ramlibacter sp.]
MSLDSYAAKFPVSSPTMTSSVARLLRQAILEGALPGGSVIRQEEVARKFGVSRVPIREALLKLEGEGLVETQPRKGVVVTVLSTDDFEEILEMRFALESLAIERAAQRFSAANTAAAMAVVEQARTILKSKRNLDLAHEFESRWGELNWSFHRRLYEPAGRPRLLATIENLQQLFARHLRMHIAAPDPRLPAARSLREDTAANLQEWAAVLDEHEQMVRACAAHDGATAVAVLKHHISDHGRELVRRLREAGTPAPDPAR